MISVWEGELGLLDAQGYPSLLPMFQGLVDQSTQEILIGHIGGRGSLQMAFQTLSEAPQPQFLEIEEELLVFR